VTFSRTDFYTTLNFVNQRNYKTLAMQTHALTRTRYFYGLNVTSDNVQVRTGLSLRMCFRFEVFPSLTSVYLWRLFTLKVMLRLLKEKVHFLRHTNQISLNVVGVSNEEIKKKRYLEQWWVRKSRPTTKKKLINPLKEWQSSSIWEQH
jgi:hypothetical protein